uniref:COesterase domain-containing protein n=1 Tax=Strongyloides papillosus TaxID=174720 RepID=A0A0N5C7P0_STREA
MIVVLLHIILILIQLCESESIIKTQHGDIQGIEKTFPEGVVTEYLGVPFARINSKRKRFMPSSELRKPEWKGVFHAKTKAVSCYQHLIKFD